MARAGARGDTASEMDQVLRTDGWDGLGRRVGALDQRLRSHDGAWMVEGGRGQGHPLPRAAHRRTWLRAAWLPDRRRVRRTDGRTFGSGPGLWTTSTRPKTPATRSTAGSRARPPGGSPSCSAGRRDRRRPASCSRTPSTSRRSGPCRSPRARRATATSSTLRRVRVPTMETLGGQELLLAHGVTGGGRPSSATWRRRGVAARDDDRDARRSRRRSRRPSRRRPFGGVTTRRPSASSADSTRWPRSPMAGPVPVRPAPVHAEVRDRHARRPRGRCRRWDDARHGPFDAPT